MILIAHIPSLSTLLDARHSKIYRDTLYRFAIQRVDGALSTSSRKVHGGCSFNDRLGSWYRQQRLIFRTDVLVGNIQ